MRVDALFLLPRLRFSLRGLLLLVALCALFCAVLGRRIYRWQIDSAAAQTIREHGGVATTRQRAPMFRRWSGIPWLRVVDGVKLTGESSHAESLAALRALAELRSLEFDGTDLDDTIVPTLAGLPSLEFLWLSGTRMTDTGIGRLPVFDRLNTVGLSHGQLGPACVAWLERQPCLTTLGLEGTRCDGQVLGMLGRPATVETLILSCDELTSDGIRALQAWPRLNTLLVQTSGTSLPWTELQRMPKLQDLIIQGRRLPNLLDQDPIAQQLRRSLPATQITVNRVPLHVELDGAAGGEEPADIHKDTLFPVGAP